MRRFYGYRNPLSTNNLLQKEAPMLKLKDLKPTEAEITKDIRGYLDIRGIPYFKKLQGLGSPKGIVDLIGCYKGCFIGIEVKVLGRELTFEQDLFIKRFKNAGGTCFVAHSVEDVERELKSIDAKQRFIYQ